MNIYTLIAGFREREIHFGLAGHLVIYHEAGSAMCHNNIVSPLTLTARKVETVTVLKHIQIKSEHRDRIQLTFQLAS